MNIDPKEDSMQIALISKDISYIQKDISTINTTLRELAGVYVTQREFMDFKSSDFANIKRVVYGAVGFILLAFLGTVVTFFITNARWNLTLYRH